MRLGRGWRLTPVRWRRLLAPLRGADWTGPPALTWQDRFLVRWWQTLDLLLVCDFYEAGSNLFSPQLRRLKEEELAFLRPIFGDSVPYTLIRIDERAHLGPRQYRFCYVSFHTINSWGAISAPTLVHEVVHVWQYVRFGAAYIPRALAAQRTPEGYDYGGVAGLAVSQQLSYFNFEQQAALVEDAFRLSHGFQGRWDRGDGLDAVEVYAPFLAALRLSS